MNKSFTLINFLLWFSIYLLSAQPIPKVLIIGIDGCKPAALQAASTPNIDLLINNATYSYDALTEAQTWSGVGWSGMLTGVWREKHGVSDNSFNGSNFGAYPHFFTNLNNCDPNLVTASIVHWGPINSEILDMADYELTVSTDLAVRQEAVTYLGNNNPDALFLHFDDVDHAGHSYGFDPTIPQYLAAIAATDAHIGEVITALENRVDYSNEEWLIILSTDHGGTLSGHGGASIEERNIFTIFSGDTIPNEHRTKTQIGLPLTDVLSLNGTDQYIDIPTDPLYNFGSSQDFTIECRVRVNSISGDPVILSNKDWNSGLNPGYVFSFPANGDAWKLNIGDGNTRVDITGGAINDGQWHHLAVSFDRDGFVKVYEDGSFVKAENISGIGNIDSSLPFTIGQDGTHSYGDWFDGELAEVRLWNTVLSEATISSNACNSISSTPTNLIGYWQINEGNGTSVVDASTNSNDGAIQGANPTWLATADELICNDYSNSLRVVDVSATALQYLCGMLDPALGLDGQSVPFIAAPLPVELLSLKGTAVAKSNQINWSVAAEKQVDQYVVERSDGNFQFENIKEILPDNDQVPIKHYEIEDRQPLPKSYYRLKILNTDGTHQYSELIVVERPLNNIQIRQLHPVPVRDQLLISFEMDTSTSCTISLYNATGQLLIRNYLAGKKGQNDLRMDFSAYSDGLYVIVLNNNQEAVRRMIVKHA